MQECHRNYFGCILVKGTFDQYTSVGKIVSRGIPRSKEVCGMLVHVDIEATSLMIGELFSSLSFA